MSQQTARRARAIGLSILGAAVLAAASATSHAAERDLRKVRVGWPAAIASNVAHISFAEALGYFAEEGLVTEVTVMQGAYNVVQQVLAGGFDTGYVGVETVVVGLQPDTPHLPLRFIYNYTRQGIWELAVPAKSDVRSIADLKGKTVGIGGPAFGNVPVLKAAIAASGLKISDVNLQPVGVGSPAFRAMTSGQIDALNLWDTMHAALERAGFPLRRLEFPEEFVGNPSHGLIATEAKIANEPELIGRFGRAWSKGEVACAANIDGCLIAFWRQYPQLKPANKTLEEAIAYERPLLAARLKKLLYFEPGAERKLGAYTNAQWDGVISALAVGGLIKKTDLPYDKLYTNAFVDAYNDFDWKTVEAEARAYR